ncbi:MAG TPA: hypothetical protein VFV67_18895 [Actinophytocola sp.]|uniref:hypothetical protein n=1 Tax=Actinophytocola sp. TaxID=1872138 RepID=UPI002DBEB627|nr:hypothetical protein [Actinophytocola sp.]HEU5472720.1 hypothetical protein [Actinophytocola sp.]
MTAVSTSPAHAGLGRVLDDITAERESQYTLWSFQHQMPDGTGPQWTNLADTARRECEHASETGQLSWRHVLVEEVAEALAEADPARLRRELVQVAAVAVQWLQAIDHRSTPAAQNGENVWPSPPSCSSPATARPSATSPGSSAATKAAPA